MPRLRRLKDYTPIVIMEEKEDYEATNEYSNSEKLGGWWSQANIIATLSDNKIKEAINNYRLAINQLELELRLRSRGIGPREPLLFVLHESEDKQLPRRTSRVSRTKRQRIERVLKKYDLQSRCGVEWLRIMEEFGVK